MKKITVTTLEELDQFAGSFISNFQKGAIVGLSGELGAGKTTFVRSIIRQIAEKQGIPTPKVVSPTFVIHQSYAMLKPPVEHLDLYRMEKLTREGLIEVGYFDALEYVKEHQGFLFVEWPEKVVLKEFLLLDILLLFDVEGDSRIISITH